MVKQKTQLGTFLSGVLLLVFVGGLALLLWAWLF